MITKNKLGVVIISYNSAKELKACIKAALAAADQARVSCEVIVVDNNSTDQSVSVSRQNEALTITNSSNLGFAKAVNLGILKAFNSGASHILILNPDTKLMPNSLSIMFGAIEGDDSVGAVGPMMISATGQSAIDGYYLKAPSLVSVVLFSTILRKYFIRRPYFVNRFYQEATGGSNSFVEQIPGACLLTSREVVNSVGLLDEDFAIWFEDVEWCYRTRRAGYKLLFCSGARVIHEGGVSFEQWKSLDKKVTFYVSMKTFFDKTKPVSGILVRLIVCLNAVLLALKHFDKLELVFIKRFLTQKSGRLPE